MKYLAEILSEILRFLSKNNEKCIILLKIDKNCDHKKNVYSCCFSLRRKKFVMLERQNLPRNLLNIKQEGANFIKTYESHLEKSFIKTKNRIFVFQIEYIYQILRK